MPYLAWVMPSQCWYFLGNAPYRHTPSPPLPSKKISIAHTLLPPQDMVRRGPAACQAQVCRPRFVAAALPKFIQNRPLAAGPHMKWHVFHFFGRGASIQEVEPYIGAWALAAPPAYCNTGVDDARAILIFFGDSGGRVVWLCGALPK